MEHRPALSGTRRLYVLAGKYRAFFLRVILYGIVMIAVIHLLQNSLIYQPHKYSMAELIQAADRYSVALWPTSDEGYRGLVAPSSSASRGTVIVFHGNGGSAFDRLHYVAALEPLRFRVVLAEYPGYGAREGRPSERALITDAKATVRLAEEDFDGPLYVWGESLGCGVATAVAADASLSVEGLALITPFASLPELAQSIYWFLPVKWLVRDKYDSITNLRGFKKPVAIVVADNDEIIPREQAQALYDSLTTQKEMWVFKDSGHNTWPASPQEKWWQEVADQLTSNTQH